MNKEMSLFDFKNARIRTLKDVNAYTEKDRKLMDKIFNLMFGDEK